MLLATGALTVAGPGQTELARAVVAARQGLSPADLEVVHATPMTLPSGVVAWHAKLRDRHDGEVYGVCLGPDNRVLDYELATMQTREPRVSDMVADRLAEIHPDDLVRVGIWLTAPGLREGVAQEVRGRHAGLELAGERPTVATDMARYEAYIADRNRTFEQTYAANAGPLVDTLRGAGHRVLYVSRCAPLVLAEVPAGAVESLARRGDVHSIDLSLDYESEIDSAVPTVQASTFWNDGYDGAGVKVAICESDRCDFQNPYISGTTRNTSGTIGSHPTEIAGVIASTYSTFRGMGSGISLYSANATSWSDADLIAATEWAIDQGCRVISCSYGSNTNLNMALLDRFYDHVIWEHFRTVTKSAGNRACYYEGNVTSPGLGWNVLTVGGTNDNNTSSWSDDGRYSCSSYKDPNSPHGDRDKPELSAVGQSHRSTEPKLYYDTYGTWISRSTDAHNGTSYAGPMVAGEAALMIDRNSTLGSWPEAIRAIAMATATHMSYGSISGGNTLDDQEGAGTIVCTQANNCVKNGWYATYYRTATNFPTEVTFPANAGEKVRVVVNWDSHTAYHTDSGKDTLASDLDLAVYDPAGGYLGGSYKWDNNFEMYEFTASTTGTYRIKVSAYRFDDSYEYMAIAWNRY